VSPYAQMTAACRRIVGIPTPTKEPTRSAGTPTSPALTCSIGRRSRPYATFGKAHPLLGYCESFGALARARPRDGERGGARCVGTSHAHTCPAQGRALVWAIGRSPTPARVLRMGASWAWLLVARLRRLVCYAEARAGLLDLSRALPRMRVTH